MNRNILKIIALVSMVLDHIGKVLFPEITVLQIIGRLAFPLFAFFIAEGYFHTRNKRRYVVLLLIFTLLAWLPFNLALGYPLYVMNVLGVFLISILGMYLIDKIKSATTYKFMFCAIFIFYIFTCLVVDFLALAPEGIVGIALPLIIYVTRSNKHLQVLCMGAILVVMSFIVGLNHGVVEGLIQAVSLVTIILIYFYNGEKGKTNLKYLFYVSYPAHLLVLWLISLII